jgi:hypothetical protein
MMFEYIQYIVIAIIAIIIGVFCKIPKSAITGAYDNAFFTKNAELINEVSQSVIPTSVLLSDIKRTLPYQRINSAKTTLHIGQLKLFLTELEFLTETLDSNLTPAIVIYAGSAPSNKLMILAEMFPNIKWILVDPNIHYIKQDNRIDQYDESIRDKILYFRVAPIYDTDKANIGQASKVAESARLINLHGVGLTLRESTRIGEVPANVSEIIANSDKNYFIIEDLYTNEISNLLEPLNTANKVLFISDIRTNIEDSPTDLDILWNSAMMYNWLKRLKPARFMLKFRCLYVSDKVREVVEREYNENTFTHEVFEDCDIKFMDDIRAGVFRYIKPEKIYLQAFAGLNSTETRLIASNLEVAEFDIVDYEEKLYYYNKIERPFGYHDGCVNEKIGLDRCADCALSCEIAKAYYDKYDIHGDAQGLIVQILRTISRSLKVDEHKYYDKMDKL